MASNDAVFQRRNKQIQDAIEGQNLKQALNLIEKRMKKGENTMFLKAWRAHVLSRHADEVHHQRGIAEALSMCKQDPPPTSLDTIDILHETLQKHGGHKDTIRDLWERAAKSKTHDLAIQIRWFTYAFEADDWKSAQKAAMSLQTNFPKQRNYYFWAIFLSYLVSTDIRGSDTDKKLFGTLAFRMASKAVDNVPSDQKELLSMPRAIQTPEELLLLVKILQSQKRYAEIVKILDSEKVGIASRIIQNDWSFVRIKLESLENAGMWTEGLSYAKSLLTVTGDGASHNALQEHDDWATWSLLINTADSINPGAVTDARNFAQAFIDSFPKSRNAQLARLDLTYRSFRSGTLKGSDLFVACQEYFERNKTKLYCFDDLAKYLQFLDPANRIKFVEYASDSQAAGNSQELADSISTLNMDDKFSVVPIINALKIEYCFQMPSDESNILKQKAEDFVARCLQLYQGAARRERRSESATTESRPVDDLCVLSAMCLIRSNNGLSPDGNEQGSRDIALIRAASILERLLSDSPHNYTALLLLVRTYLLLGAGSLALKTFSKLSVKQFQFETVAHNLFTRLATIHPHSAPPVEGAEYKDFDPQSAFVQALDFYRHAELTTVRQRANGLEYGSYTNVEGTIDLQRRLRDSICQKLWLFEARRVQRLVGGTPMGRYDESVKDKSPLVDQRTFDGFMNCEPPGSPKFEEQVRLGPLPGEKWIASARVTDKIFSLIKRISLQKADDMEFDFPSPGELTGPEAGSEMTAVEIESTRVNICLLKIVLFMGGTKSVTHEEVDDCLSQVEKWLASKLKDFSPGSDGVSEITSATAVYLQQRKPSGPSWKYLHCVFVTLESLKAISLIAMHAVKKDSMIAKLPRDRASRLEGLARQVHECIRASTRALKSLISEPGLLGGLVETVLGGSDHEKESCLRRELDRTIDPAALELFCGSLMESWEDSLDGVLEVLL